ncbi:MAG: DNA polymerase III subunit alpha [Bacteroidetes bacterium]|nr:MAG: DNA polymerase III subunit alpha [Bacteroidota bacterium]
MLLNNHSYYSLRYGTFSVEELVVQAQEKGWKRLALTEINNSTSMADFVKSCSKANIIPAAGIEFRETHKLLYIGLARNREGFHQLNQFLSAHNIAKEKLPERAPQLPDVFYIYPLSKLDSLLPLRDDEYVGIRYFELTQLLHIPKRLHLKLVALQPVSHKGNIDYKLHKHLRAIDRNCLLSQLQSSDSAHASEKLPSESQLRKAFSSAEFLVDNAKNLLNKCSIVFDFKSVKNKKHFTKSIEEDHQMLRRLAYEGMGVRYGRYNVEAKERVNKELAIIKQLGFSAYFLITWDIVQYAKSKDYYHVGRGSGANSVVAYCLGIVDVDPIELNLYFERFINPKRSSPPDFDLDFSWKERNDVQAYIFNRYGKNHVALLGTISTFKGKSIYRELSKVYGLPKEETDDLIRYPMASRNQNDITCKIHQFATMMTGFPNMRSIHAGGVLVSEEPLTYHTALDMPPKGFPTTQWDMYIAEDLGFEKIDILSQRGIGHIKDAVSLVEKTQGQRIDFHQVEMFKEDPKVRALLRSGETVGCFYIESPAMRGLIQKLRCDNYLTLVAASSIIRPGVSKSGMMKEYILRYNNPEQVKYLHPIMEQQLKETFGVMVYQEDVLKICHHFAGLDLADADVLRRAMSGKTRSKDEFDLIVSKFFANCRSYGYPESVTKEVWRQIESFAGYSFSKAHSASYAVESYQSLYLKAYFPLEFMVAVINNFGGFYHTWVYFNEAKRLGAQLHLPDVNRSLYLTTLYNKDVYVGFIHIQNLERSIAKRIVNEREQEGIYQDLANFVDRVNIGIESLLLLIRVGAFRFIGKEKSALMWEAHTLLRKNSKSLNVITRNLFPLPNRKFHLPKLESDQMIDAYDEVELLGFPLTYSHFDMLKTKFRGAIMTKQLNSNVGRFVRMLGQLVTIKYVKTIRKDYMHFATFLDFEGNLFDSVHFPDSLKAYPFQGNGVYLMYGKVVEEFGYAMLEISKLVRMPIYKNPLEN